jgi:hypothetical protein
MYFEAALFLYRKCAMLYQCVLLHDNDPDPTAALGFPE